MPVWKSSSRERTPSMCLQRYFGGLFQGISHHNTKWKKCSRALLQPHVFTKKQDYTDGFPFSHMQKASLGFKYCHLKMIQLQTKHLFARKRLFATKCLGLLSWQMAKCVLCTHLIKSKIEIKVKVPSVIQKLKLYKILSDSFLQETWKVLIYPQ